MISGLRANITDIFVAYPIIGEIKVNKLVELSRRASLRTAVNSIEGARELSGAFTAAGMHIKVLIELEGSMGRSGIFARALSVLPGLCVTGVMTFHGNIYSGKSEPEYISDTKKETAELLEAQRILRQAGIACDELSEGSSFSSKFPQHLQGITEARAGTYIF